MPRQLIYTSPPRGLTLGQSGYCTVARSRDLREALIPSLEKLSYYTPKAKGNPVISMYRILEVRGTRFHVISRIASAGLDFTKRSHFIAQHVIFEPHEIENAPSPAYIIQTWTGWLEGWEGEPQFLDVMEPFPSERKTPNRSVWEEVTGSRTNCVALIHSGSNTWITGDLEDRQLFLPMLDEGLTRLVEAINRPSAAWDYPFTTCFQPGDHASDFRIKAAWPATPGYEEAKRQSAKFVRLRELRAVPETSTVQDEPAPLPPKRIEKMLEPQLPPPPRKIPWPLVTAGAVVIVLGAILYSRFAQHLEVSQPVPVRQPVVLGGAAPKSAPEITINLDQPFPDVPTWLAAFGKSDESVFAPIPALERLIKELHNAEIFSRNLRAQIQTNLFTAPAPAVLDAKPDQNLLRFSPENINAPAIDLFFRTHAHVRASSKENFALSIEGAFRVLAVRQPINLPRSLIKVDNTSISMHPTLEARLQKITVPKSTQFALRPLTLSKTGEWIDALAPLEKDFELSPATSIDLPSLQSHFNQVLSKKASEVASLKEEEAELIAQEKRALTDFKGGERLGEVKVMIDKRAAELESLRARVAGIPQDFRKVERFALLLCQSNNVNTEIIRFQEP